MRQGRVFKRCGKCGVKVTERRCGCGSDVFSWAFVVDIASKGSPRQQKRQGGFRTKAEAVAAMNRLQVEKADGTHIEPTKETVGQYLEAWVVGLSGSGEIRPSTATSYELAVRRHLVPLIGTVPLQKLTRNEVKAGYDALRTRPSGRGNGAGLSPKTIHNTHLALHRALNDALEAGLIRSNPANSAHRLGTDQRAEMVCWSASELRQFLSSVAADDLYPLWRLAASTGMRRGEILGLRWRDVDFEAARIQVYQQLARQGDKVGFGAPKTKAGRRNIALAGDAITIAALRAQEAAQKPNKLKCGPAYRSALDLVFCRPDGSPLDPDVVTSRFERLVSRARVKRITFHGLRHTHATLALQAGIHPKVVQQRLGHSSVMVTLDRYSHAIPAMEEEAAGRIAAVVDGLG